MLRAQYVTLNTWLTLYHSSKNCTYLTFITSIYFLLPNLCHYYHNSLLPSSFYELYSKTNEIHKYNTRQAQEYRTPFCRTNIRLNNILFKGFLILNSLPSNIKSSKTIITFKNKLSRLSTLKLNLLTYRIPFVTLNDKNTFHLYFFYISNFIHIRNGFSLSFFHLFSFSLFSLSLFTFVQIHSATSAIACHYLLKLLVNKIQRGAPNHIRLPVSWGSSPHFCKKDVNISQQCKTKCR